MECSKILVDIVFKGINSFNNPIYKLVNGNKYYGSCNTLFPNIRIAPNNTVEEVDNYFKENLDDLVYFGRAFDCEPEGNTLLPTHKFNIIDSKQNKKIRL